MFYSRHINNEINKLHERALRIIYDDYKSSFEQLLENDKSFCIYNQNIQRLIIEMDKVLNDISGSILKEFFVRKDLRINLRSEPELLAPLVSTELKDKNLIRYFGSVIWNSVPSEIRKDMSLLSVKSRIKNWKLDNCHCRICKNNVKTLEFYNTVE